MLMAATYLIVFLFYYIPVRPLQGVGGMGIQDSRYGNKFVGGSSMGGGGGGPLIKGTKRSTRCIRDASGQLIIDQEEDNLSDKEMYARNVPAIGKHARHVSTR